MELKMQIGESYLEFCNRVLSNYKQYGFATARDCFKELTGIDMFDNARKGRSTLKNIQKAQENGYWRKFNSEKYNKEIISKDDSIVLVIGDLHTPFEHENYLSFCKNMYNKWKCNKVVFIGDILDNHYSSYHETNPDGFGGAKELLFAQKSIAEFHRNFPNAKVCIGNHDALGDRKAFSSGLSNRWIKSIGEVLNTPTWEYSDSFMIDGVKYTHGTGRKARQRSQQDMVSICQGHYHSESYIENYVGENGIRRFAMQIGCGIDLEAYAFSYGKHFAKPHLNVGIIINGKIPIIEYMDVD